MIAHRLSVRNMDHIIVVQDSEIARRSTTGCSKRAARIRHKKAAQCGGEVQHDQTHPLKNTLPR